METEWKSIGLYEHPAKHQAGLYGRASAIIIRNGPESIRRALKAKAALDGKSMQGLILELITKFVGDDSGRPRKEKT